jgi:hypothetical protein
MRFQITAGRPASGLSVSRGSRRKCRSSIRSGGPASSSKSPSRGSVALLALAAVVIVGAAGCGSATTGFTPAATPAASQTSPTPTPTPTSAPAPAPAPAPAQTTSPPPAPAPAPPAPSPAQPASCYPLSDEGTCYEPGEYCRDDDQGMTGVAGDGESIECEYNDGLRWEPIGATAMISPPSPPTPTPTPTPSASPLPSAGADGAAT